MKFDAEGLLEGGNIRDEFPATSAPPGFKLLMLFIASPDTEIAEAGICAEVNNDSGGTEVILRVGGGGTPCLDK